MSVWLLIAKVIAVWFAVSIGGGLLILGVLEVRYHRAQRRLSNVVPLYPQSSHVRLVSSKDAS